MTSAQQATLLHIFVYAGLGEEGIGFVRETNYFRFLEARTAINPNNVAYTSLLWRRPMIESAVLGSPDD